MNSANVTRARRITVAILEEMRDYLKEDASTKIALMAGLRSGACTPYSCDASSGMLSLATIVALARLRGVDVNELLLLAEDRLFAESEAAE